MKKGKRRGAVPAAGLAPAAGRAAAVFSPGAVGRAPSGAAVRRALSGAAAAVSAPVPAADSRPALPGRGSAASLAERLAGPEGDPFGGSLTDNPVLLTDLYRRNWLARRIIDMPCEDMTRAWYTLPSSLPPEAAEALARLEARHGIRREVTDAIRWARLYGGSCALMVLRGQERALDQPLDPDTVAPGDFQGLLVRDRISGAEPSLELEEDLDDPDYGYPRFYDFDTEALGRLRVHHSRIIRFIGRDLPRQEEIARQYWGDSELEHIREELEKRSATSRNIARLVFQANITTLKMSDFGETLAMGTERQKQEILSAMEAQNRMRDSFGLQLLSAGDDYENHPYSFAGLSEVYEAFMMDMAGAAGIPATRLFGRSPEGMNATGESDLRNYYEMIDQLRERHLRPALEKLLPVMLMSCWGSLPEDLSPSFPSLMTPDPREEAEIRARNADTLLRALAAGLLSPADARERLLEML